MGSLDSYSKAAAERAMKVQEVIWRALAKKLSRIRRSDSFPRRACPG